MRLGKVQVIKPIDDGGISMYFRRDPSSTQQSRRIVLSVEVNPLTIFLTKSRRNGRNTQKEMTNILQIVMLLKYIAEMLGQVCHPEFYNVMDNEYQEVFPANTVTYNIVLCNSYSTCENLLVLCKVTKHVSRADF